MLGCGTLTYYHGNDIDLIPDVKQSYFQMQENDGKGHATVKPHDLPEG
jgi:hypothetical protein